MTEFKPYYENGYYAHLYLPMADEHIYGTIVETTRCFGRGASRNEVVNLIKIKVDQKREIYAGLVNHGSDNLLAEYDKYGNIFEQYSDTLLVEAYRLDRNVYDLFGIWWDLNYFDPNHYVEFDGGSVKGVVRMVLFYAVKTHLLSKPAMCFQKKDIGINYEKALVAFEKTFTKTGVFNNSINTKFPDVKYAVIRKKVLKRWIQQNINRFLHTVKEVHEKQAKEHEEEARMYKEDLEYMDSLIGNDYVGEKRVYQRKTK